MGGPKHGLRAATLALVFAGGCGPSAHRMYIATSDANPDPGGGEGGGGGTGGAGGGGAGGVSGAGGAGGMAGRDANAPAPDLAPPPDAGREASPPADVAPPPDRPPPDLAPPADAGPDGPASLAMGLVSRWKLDEGTGVAAGDSAAQPGNPGTLVGGATWITPGYPTARYANPGALSLDGVDDQVDLGITGMPAFNEPQTVAFWMTYTTAPASYQSAFTFFNDGTGRLKFGLRMDTIAVWRSGGPVLAVAAPAAGWHHVAYTFDGQTQRLYVDGTSVDTSTAATDTGAVTGARLGAYIAERYKGDLDDVRIYRRALMAAEVRALAAGLE